MAVKYEGTGKLTPAGIEAAAKAAGIELNALKAVIAVETSGKPFDKAGRLSMLFEPHVFYRVLSKRGHAGGLATAVHDGLAYEKWGTKPYPKDSYPAFLKACAIDEELACQACSWGMGQILGENFADVGCASAVEMVDNMASDPDLQALYMAAFVAHNHLVQDLNLHNWESFAHGYNGSHYKANAYDSKLEAAYAGLSPAARIHTDGLPDHAVDAPKVELPRPNKGLLARLNAPAPATVEVELAPTLEAAVAEQLKPIVQASPDDIKWAQQRLYDLGYFEVGMVDGKPGKRTEGAVLAFRNEHGLPLDPNVDDDLKLALISAKPRSVSVERSAVTAADLKPRSPILQAASMTKLLSYATAGIGAVVSLASSIGPNIATATSQLEPVKAIFSDIPGWIYGVAVVGVAVLIWVQASAVETARVAQFKTGRTT